MLRKGNKKDQYYALLQAAENKRSFAQAMLNEAEADMVKARMVYQEWMDEEQRKAAAEAIA